MLHIVLEAGLWSEYRRAYNIWKDILTENRIEKGEV
jgi:hypothetical protein